MSPIARIIAPQPTQEDKESASIGVGLLDTYAFAADA
jgi:hypothetical protein